jgi:hypothetical protein
MTNTTNEMLMTKVADFLLAATDRKDREAIALGFEAKDELERDEEFQIAVPRVLRRLRAR